MANNGIDRRKNLKIALKAFNKFNKSFPHSTLTLFGRHGMEQGGVVHKWAKKNNLDKNVYFHGFIENLMKVLHKYDVLLHPSLEETFGMIYFEAMIKGVPIVAGKNSGATPEIIKNNGLLVDVNDIEQIVNGLKKYIQNPALWKKIRKSAYTHAKLKNNYKTIAKKYLYHYKKILNY